MPALARALIFSCGGDGGWWRRRRCLLSLCPRYEQYKGARTVGEYLALGGSRADVKFDYQRRYLAVLRPKEGEAGGFDEQWADVVEASGAARHGGGCVLAYFGMR